MPATDDEYANSTSTNAALLPGAAPMADDRLAAAKRDAKKGSSTKNGFLWTSGASSPVHDKSPAFPSILIDAETDSSAAAAAAVAADVLMTELGHQPRVDVRTGLETASSGKSGGGKRSRTGGSSLCYYLRRYRCQLVFVLIAFIEFGLLIAGLTFYFAGVLTATCDSQGKVECSRIQMTF